MSFLFLFRGDNDLYYERMTGGNSNDNTHDINTNGIGDHVGIDNCSRSWKDYNINTVH